MLANGNDAWANSVNRVNVAHWLLDLGALQFDRPVRLQWARCAAPDAAGHQPKGPCANQTADAYSIGGVDYGDFLID